MSTISNSRAAKIQNILDKRKPLADRTGKKIEHLLALKHVLGEFQGFFRKIQGKINDDNGISVLHSLKNELNNFLSDHGTIGKCLNDLMQLKARFGRPTLNIGIVGNARNGKSTFLQSLTGLSDNEMVRLIRKTFVWRDRRG